ncbi:MAG: RND family efflux transporter MFP subunit [Candidatus Paceibacteria bacterium]|jgi:RND family efflux transporter MFP subunit
MNLYNKMKFWLGRKAVRGALLLALIIIAALVVLGGRDKTPEEVSEDLLPVVSVTTAQQYAGESTINLIGTVRAFSEASITSEKAGRVTGVRVALGDTVAAGSIIVTLENASENASVLSAQGSYEAALAGAAQNSVGTEEAATRVRGAENSLVSTVKSAYTTVDGIVNNSIDQFYSNPDGFVPGLRIDGKGSTQTLNNIRIEYQTLLVEYKTRSAAVAVNVNLETELTYISAQVAKTLNYVDTFITVFQSQDNSARYTREELVEFGNTFNGLRSSLIQTQSQLDAAQTALQSAEEGLERAQLAAAGGTNSAADAQVKQALGSLRSAQAQLAKTIIRTPISGTVNSLNARTGDFINSFTAVAEVANNNALEVVTFAGEKDRSVIAVGDTVLIENKFAGTVTEVAPAVDAGTGKTEVRIASESEDLQNGDSVQITKTVAGSVITDVIIPLSAVKFALNDGSVFVVEDGRLVPRLVELGTIRGGSVEIVSGLSVAEEFVADARGLVESTLVEVIR